jgi:hypothetical protein
VGRTGSGTLSGDAALVHAGDLPAMLRQADRGGGASDDGSFQVGRRGRGQSGRRDGGHAVPAARADRPGPPGAARRRPDADLCGPERACEQVGASACQHGCPPRRPCRHAGAQLRRICRGRVGICQGRRHRRGAELAPVGPGAFALHQAGRPGADRHRTGLRAGARPAGSRGPAGHRDRRRLRAPAGPRPNPSRESPSTRRTGLSSSTPAARQGCPRGRWSATGR